jgi:hypothetical protein
MVGRGSVCRRMDLANDGAGDKQVCREESDEDKDAPAGAEAFAAEEDAM